MFFDVNETLSDTTPVLPVLHELGAHGTTPSTWLAATLRDGFALSLTTGARTFPEVARQTLTGLLAAEPDLDGPVDDAVERVMSVFGELPVHEDVVDGVRRLATADHRLVALSNGTVDYAGSLLRRAGIADAFHAVLSVDAVGAWKPDRRTYDHAASVTGTAPADAVLVAVHPWDLHGARAAGFRTVHVDRTATPWPQVFDAPDTTVRSLADLAAVLHVL